MSASTCACGCERVARVTIVKRCKSAYKRAHTFVMNGISSVTMFVEASGGGVERP
jgi:hypothetical protein